MSSAQSSTNSVVEVLFSFDYCMNKERMKVNDFHIHFINFEAWIQTCFHFAANGMPCFPHYKSPSSVSLDCGVFSVPYFPEYEPHFKHK